VLLPIKAKWNERAGLVDHDVYRDSHSLMLLICVVLYCVTLLCVLPLNVLEFGAKPSYTNPAQLRGAGGITSRSTGLPLTDGMF